jgi:TonB-linked SusC/RagA family outer membrane protein
VFKTIFRNHFKQLQFMNLFMNRHWLFAARKVMPCVRSQNLFALMRIGSLILTSLFLCSQLLLAKPGNGQNIRDVYITLRLKGESLENAFKKIERATPFLFAYQTEQVAAFKNINLPKGTRTVSETLTILLGRTDLLFRQEGNNIIIYKKRKNNPADNSGISAMQPVGYVAITLSGIVTNARGEVLQGVSVMVRGSSKGTITDSKGFFSLILPDDPKIVLEISAVGYAPQTYTVKTATGDTQIHITLQESVTGLSDVVVIGYGQQKKINLTGSVVSLDAAQIKGRAAANISGILAGQAPGLTVLQTGGAPGRDAGTLNVHGIGTLGISSPLIVVDGIKTDSYTQIDPNDIESISVLKDAASSAIYGIDAANGVIIITTKRGEKGKLKVDYHFQYGGSGYIKLPEKVNSWELATMYDSAQANDGTPSSAFKFSAADIQQFKDGSNPLTHANTDWIKSVFSRPGTWMSHNLSLSGGTDDTKYNISFGYLDQGGIMESTGYKRYSFRANFDQRFSDRLSAGFNLSVTQGNISDPPTVLGVGGETWYLHEAFQQWANDPIYTKNGDYAYPIWSGLNHNPVAYASSANGYFAEKDTRLVGTAFAEFKIISGLSLKGIGSTTRDYNYQSDVGLGVDLYPVDPVTGEPSPVPNNTTASMPATPSTTSVYRGFFHGYDNTLQLLLNYSNRWGKSYVNALLGYEVGDQNQEQEDITRMNLSDPALNQINAADPTNQITDGNTLQFRSQSVFGRAGYIYDNKYLFEADARQDATSRFAPGHRKAIFPAFSAGWVVSREHFFKVPAISTLKLRGSWGILGNQQIPNYLYLPTYALGSYYLFNGTRVTGVNEGPLANALITWEKTTNQNVAIDIAFLQDRLQLTGEYFVKNTKNILLQLNQPAILGAAPPEANAGSVRNKGFDIILSYKDHIGEVEYFIGGNFNYVKNRITDLAGTQYPGREIGDPIDNLYGYVAEGIFRDEAQISKHADQSALGGVSVPGDIIYRDLNNDGKIDASDQQNLGTYFPEITYGFNFGANYKGFDFSTVWSGAADVHASIAGSRLAQPFGDFGSSPIRAQLDHWTPENPNASFPRLSFNASYNYVPSSFWARNTAYLKLRNVQVGYALPARLLKSVRISRIRVYVSGENLLMISPFKIMDPESLTNGDPFFGFGGTGAYPTTKKYLAGISVTF